MKKIEFSKFLVVFTILIFVGVAVWSMIEYYLLVKLAISNNSSVTPDPSLAVTSITTILGAVISYCLYQFGLKNSRNKFGVDSEGQPFKEEIIDSNDDEKE